MIEQWINELLIEIVRVSPSFRQSVSWWYRRRRRQVPGRRLCSLFWRASRGLDRAASRTCATDPVAVYRPSDCGRSPCSGLSTAAPCLKQCNSIIILLFYFILFYFILFYFILFYFILFYLFDWLNWLNLLKLSLT